jgi:hypothetical protein
LFLPWLLDIEATSPTSVRKSRPQFDIRRLTTPESVCPHLSSGKPAPLSTNASCSLRRIMINLSQMTQHSRSDNSMEIACFALFNVLEISIASFRLARWSSFPSHDDSVLCAGPLSIQKQQKTNAPPVCRSNFADEKEPVYSIIDCVVGRFDRSQPKPARCSRSHCVPTG